MRRYSEAEYYNMISELNCPDHFKAVPYYKELANLLSTEWLSAIVDGRIDLYGGTNFTPSFCNACKEELAERIILNEDV